MRLRMLAIILMILPLGAAAQAGDLPDPQLTPGVTTNETKAQVCAKTTHTKDERNVPESEKRKVYAAYNQDPKAKPCPCEVDHLISLEIGGSNDIKNLWPQSYNTKPWNAHIKDKLENHLHKLVCAGTITLQEAQHAISTNWIDAYKKYIDQ